jgi:hypothetical protein
VFGAVVFINLIKGRLVGDEVDFLKFVYSRNKIWRTSVVGVTYATSSGHDVCDLC